MLFNERLKALEGKWVRMRTSCHKDGVRICKMLEVHDDYALVRACAHIRPRRVLWSEKPIDRHKKAAQVEFEEAIRFDHILAIMCWEEDQYEEEKPTADVHPIR